MNNNKEKQNKKTLGRGLGSLLGGGAYDGAASNNLNTQNEYSSAQQPSGNLITQDDASSIKKQELTTIQTVVEEDKKIWLLSIDKLVPGQFQPRKHFDKEKIHELAQSIKENGILQPIVVRKRQAGGFEIIAGERRWRAAQVAGLHDIPAIIKSYTDQEALQLALIENIQREDLDPIEEAESYQRLIEEFGLSQQEAADKVGKERSTVANAIRLLALPNEIKNLMSDGKISVGHAKVLLSIPEKAQQIKLVKAAVEKELSVRALEALIKSNQRESEVADQKLVDRQDISHKLAVQLAQQLQKKLATKTEIKYKKGKGSLTIQFYTDDQLNSIYERLVK